MKPGKKEIKTDAVAAASDTETEGTSAVERGPVSRRPAFAAGENLVRDGAANIACVADAHIAPPEAASRRERSELCPSPQSPDGDSPPSPPSAGEGAVCNDAAVSDDNAETAGEQAPALQGENVVVAGESIAETESPRGDDSIPSPQSPDGDSSPSPQAGEGAAREPEPEPKNESETNAADPAPDSDKDENAADTETDDESEAESDDRSEPDPAPDYDKDDGGERELFDRWDREIPEAEARYPGFDMRREMSDPGFARLALAVGVCGAYELTHRRELDARLCAAAFRLASERTAAAAASNFARPAEGGLARTAAPLVKVDPRHLTSEERLDVRRRLKGGEHITF